MDGVRVSDRDDILTINFDNLVNYHGRAAICGLSVTYKVIQCGFEALVGDGAPDREKLSVLSAFPGPGARDAFELIGRVVTNGRYEVDKTIPPSEQISEAAAGSYYFRIDHGDRSVELGVKPGVVRQEFIDLKRKQTKKLASPEDLTRLRELQFEMSERVLPQDPSEIVNVIRLSG